MKVQKILASRYNKVLVAGGALLASAANAQIALPITEADVTQTGTIITAFGTFAALAMVVGFVLSKGSKVGNRG